VIVAPFKVVLDANVLFPFTVRDTLLRAAHAGFFQVYWSEEILDEAARNLVATSTISEEQAARLMSAVRGAFPEAVVKGHERLIAVMPNEPKDRHVAAVAVKVGAQVIVTSNLRDFRSLPEGVEAQSPDDFLCNLFDLDPDALVSIVRAQAAALGNPPRSFEDIVRGLAKIVPEFAECVARRARAAV
jgi:predicted nucleic acid-binding protein